MPEDAKWRSATGRVIASCFALAAFAVALIAGLFSGNTAAQILLRALMAMVVCYPAGVVIGAVCLHVIATHVQQHRQLHPAASTPEPMSAATAADDSDVLVI